MSISDQQIRDIVDVVFMRYDKDSSGTLDRDEVQVLINDVFSQLEMHKLADPLEIGKFIDQIDTNRDGLIQKH
jgi:Ca2+-binding EF-hand superfamily protein